MCRCYTAAPICQAGWQTTLSLAFLRAVRSFPTSTGPLSEACGSLRCYLALMTPTQYQDRPVRESNREKNLAPGIKCNETPSQENP